MSAESTPDVVQSKASAGGVEVPQEEEGFRVFVGNLSFKTTEDELKDFVGKSGGDILSVTIPVRANKRPSGYGFVNFKTDDAARHAVESLQGSELNERKLQLQIARSKEEQDAHRAQVNERRAAREPKKQEEKANGEATAAEGAEGAEKPKKKSKKRTPRRRVPGEEGEETLVEGETTAGGETSDAAPKKRNPRTRKPREARIDAVEGEESAEQPAKEPRERKPRQPKLQLTDELSSNTIFVANLPFSVDDAALASIFTNLSIAVKSAKVVRGPRKGRGGKTFRASRGFGFVEVEDAAQQKEAVEKVEGSLIGERKISAKVANEMKPVEIEAAQEGGEAPAETATA